MCCSFCRVKYVAYTWILNIPDWKLVIHICKIVRNQHSGHSLALQIILFKELRYMNDKIKLPPLIVITSYVELKLNWIFHYTDLIMLIIYLILSIFIAGDKCWWWHQRHTVRKNFHLDYIFWTKGLGFWYVT